MLVLSESRRLRFATVTAMYLAQGIQLGLLIIAFAAYLAKNQVSPIVIGGFIGAVVMPWTFKLLYAPMMERYTYLPMGRRRPWMLCGTIGGALGYLAMAFVPEPLAHLGVLTAFMVGGSVFLALQDIATDALVVDIVPLEEQAQANSLMWGGKTLSTAASAAAAGWLFNKIGPSGTFAAAAALTACFTLIPLLVRERPGERMLPWTSGAASSVGVGTQLSSWGDIGRSLQRVALLTASLLLAGAAFAMETLEGLYDAFIPVFTVQNLGWTDEAFSSTQGLAKLCGGVVGMLGGGLLIRWLGHKRALQVALVMIAVLSLALGFAIKFNPPVLVTQALLLLWVTVFTLLMISYFSTAMALCWKPVSAVQFALYMAISNLGYITGSSAAGPLLQWLSPQLLVSTMAIVAVLIAILLTKLDVAEHIRRLADLNEEVPTSQPTLPPVVVPI